MPLDLQDPLDVFMQGGQEQEQDEQEFNPLDDFILGSQRRQQSPPLRENQDNPLEEFIFGPGGSQRLRERDQQQREQQREQQQRTELFGRTITQAIQRQSATQSQTDISDADLSHMVAEIRRNIPDYQPDQLELLDLRQQANSARRFGALTNAMRRISTGMQDSHGRTTNDPWQAHRITLNNAAIAGELPIGEIGFQQRFPGSNMLFNPALSADANRAARRIEAGNASEGDYNLVAYLTAQAINSRDATAIERATELLSFLPTYAAEFMMTGGLGSAIRNRTASALGGGAAGRVAGFVAGGSVRAPSAFGNRFMEERNPVRVMQHGTQDQPGLAFDWEQQTGVPTAAARSAVSAAIEGVSEQTGDLLPGFSRWLGSTRIAGALQRLPIPQRAQALGSLASRYLAAPASRALQQMGYHGVAGEMLEERLSEALHAGILGDDAGLLGAVAAGNWEEVRRQSLAEAAAFAVPGMAHRAGRAIATLPEQRQVQDAASSTLARLQRTGLSEEAAQRRLDDAGARVLANPTRDQALEQIADNSPTAPYERAIAQMLPSYAPGQAREAAAETERVAGGATNVRQFAEEQARRTLADIRTDTRQTMDRDQIERGQGTGFPSVPMQGRSLSDFVREAQPSQQQSNAVQESAATTAPEAVREQAPATQQSNTQADPFPKIDHQQRQFIENRIQQLGSLQAVQEAYKGKSVVHEYARWRAGQVFGTNQNPAPVNQSAPAVNKPTAQANQNAERLPEWDTQRLSEIAGRRFDPVRTASLIEGFTDVGAEGKPKTFGEILETVNRLRKSRGQSQLQHDDLRPFIDEMVSQDIIDELGDGTFVKPIPLTDEQIAEAQQIAEQVRAEKQAKNEPKAEINPAALQRLIGGEERGEGGSPNPAAIERLLGIEAENFDEDLIDDERTLRLAEERQARAQQPATPVAQPAPGVASETAPVEQPAQEQTPAKPKKKQPKRKPVRDYLGRMVSREDPKRAVYVAVLSHGGINPKKVGKDYDIDLEFHQEGLGGLLNNQSQFGLDEMAETLRSEGHISQATEDHLLGVLKTQALSLLDHNAIEAEIIEQERRHYEEIEAARKAGFTPDAIEESGTVGGEAADAAQRAGEEAERAAAESAPSTDKTESFLIAALQRMAEFSELPTTKYGGKPKFKFTGDLVNDLNRLADVDTAYLDDLYTEMNNTGLYSGNNEVLRTLHGRFRDLKRESEGGGARTAEQIEQTLGDVETQIENASAALDELGHHSLAEFYARASSVALAAKEYAVAHYSRDGRLGDAYEPPGSSAADVVIDRSSLLQEFGEEVMKRGGDAVRQRVAQALKDGKEVTLYIEGKPRRIVSGDLHDDKGRRWGLLPILQPLPGNHDRIEITAAADVTPDPWDMPPGSVAFSAGGFLQFQALDEWLSKGKPVMSFLKQWLTSRGHLPADVFDAKVRMDGRVAAYLQDIRSTERDLRRAVGSYRSLNEQQIKAMDAALRGDPAALQSLDPKVREVIESMREQVDNLSRALIDSGAIAGPLAATVEANIGAYLNRAYRVFLDPQWADKVPVDVRNRFKSWLRAEEIYRAMKKWQWRNRKQLRQMSVREQFDAWQEAREEAEPTEEYLEGRTRDLLYNAKAAESPIAFLSRSKLGSKDLGVTRRRKELPDELRALWGEYDDPLINYTNSIARMSQLMASHEFLTDAKQAGMGRFFFEKPNPEHYAQIAAEGSEVMEPLNGLYTTPEIQQAFKDIYSKQNLPKWLQLYMTGMAWTKYSKTVGSYTSVIRNWISNIGFAVANGHWNISKMIPAMQAITKDSGQWRDYWRRMLELGVVGESIQGNEVRETITDILAEKEGRFGEVHGMITDRSLRRLAKRGAGIMETFYHNADAVWKIYAFENEKARYQQAYPAWSSEQVEKKAAQIVRDTYPTYSMVPKAVRGLRRFPLTGPFVSFPAEVIRNTKNTAVQAFRELQSPETRRIGAQRLAGLMAATTGTTILAMAVRAMLGIDPDDEKDMRRFMPPWSQSSPILHLGQDQQGNYRYLDLGYSDPYSILREPIIAAMQGEDIEDAAGDAFTAAARPFIFDEELLTSRVFDVARNRTADGREVYNPQAPAFDQLRAKIKHITEAFTPGSYTSARRLVMAATGEPEPTTGRTYTLADELKATATGQRQQTLDVSRSLVFRGRNFQGAMSDATRILTSVARLRGNVSDQELQSAHGQMEEVRRRLFDGMRRDVLAAQRLGMTNQEVLASLDQSGVSEAMAADLMSGRYRVYSAERLNLGQAPNAERRESVIAGAAAQGMDQEQRNELAGPLLYRSTDPRPTRSSRESTQYYQERVAEWQQSTERARNSLSRLNLSSEDRRRLLLAEWRRRGMAPNSPSFRERMGRLR